MSDRICRYSHKNNKHHSTWSDYQLCKIKPTDLDYEKFLSQFVREEITGGAPTNKLVTFRLVEKINKGRIKNQTVDQNWPAICGMPITFRPGNKVKTLDGRDGIVFAFEWIHELVLFTNGIPRAGYFVCKVKIGDKIEHHIRNDLDGKRIRRL